MNEYSGDTYNEGNPSDRDDRPGVRNTRASKAPVLRLAGADSNAFSILALAGAAFRRAGATPERLAQFRGEATSGNYEHLLQVVLATAEELGVEVQ